MKTRLFLLFYFLAAFAVLGFTNVSPRPGVNWDLGASTNQWNALYVKTGVFSGPIIGNGSGLTNLLNVGSGESNAFYILLMTTNALPNSIAIHTLFNASNFVTRVQLAGSNFVDQTDLNSSNFATYPIIATSNFVNFTQLAGSNFLTGAGLSSSNYVTMPWLAGSNFVNFTQLAGSNFITGTALAGYNYATFVNIAGSNFANFTQIAGSNFVNFTQLAGSNFTSQANIGSSNFANFTQIAGSNFTSQANIGSSNFVNFTQLAGSNFTSQANIGSSNFANFTQIAGSNFTSQANIGSSNFVTQVGLAGSNYVNNLNGKATNLSTYGPFQSFGEATLYGLTTVANSLAVNTNIISAGTIIASNTVNGRSVSMDATEGSITLGGDKRTNWPTTTTGAFIENNNGKGTNTTIYGRLTINTQLYVFTNQVFPVNTRGTNGVSITSTTNAGIIYEVYQSDNNYLSNGYVRSMTGLATNLQTYQNLFFFGNMGSFNMRGGNVWLTDSNYNRILTLYLDNPIPPAPYNPGLHLWKEMVIRSNNLTITSPGFLIAPSASIGGDMRVAGNIYATNVILWGNLTLTNSTLFADQIDARTNVLLLGNNGATNAITINTNGGVKFAGSVTMTNGNVSLTNLTSPTDVINVESSSIFNYTNGKYNMTLIGTNASGTNGIFKVQRWNDKGNLLSIGSAGGIGNINFYGDGGENVDYGTINWTDRKSPNTPRAALYRYQNTGLVLVEGSSKLTVSLNNVNVNTNFTLAGSILQTNPASISSFAGPVEMNGNVTMTNGTVSLTNLTSPTGILIGSGTRSNTFFNADGNTTNFNQLYSYGEVGSGNSLRANSYITAGANSFYAWTTKSGYISQTNNGTITVSAAQLAVIATNGGFIQDKSTGSNYFGGSATFGSSILQTNHASISSFAGPLSGSGGVYTNMQFSATSADVTNFGTIRATTYVPTTAGSTVGTASLYLGSIYTLGLYGPGTLGLYPQLTMGPGNVKIFANANGGTNGLEVAGSIIQTNPTCISSFAGPVNLLTNLNVGGFLTQTQAAWDDVRIAGSSMKLPASGNPTPKDFAGTIQALAFDKNTMNSAGFELQLPHGINTNFGTHIHIHYAVTNAASTNCVVWGIEYTMANPQSPFNPVTTTMYVTNAPGTNWFQQLPEFPTIYGFKESAVMVARIFRDAANSADSHDDDAYLLSVDAHYVRKAFGSANELGDY